MAKCFYLVAIILWGASSWGKLSTTECGPRALATKNCHISWAELKIHIRGDKINTNNGVHRSLVDFPVAGASVEWKKLVLRHLNKELFLEAEVWGEPAEKTDVSDLNWLVFKFSDVTPDLVIQKVIQSRKPVQSHEKGKKAFKLMDKALPHKLLLEKKKVYWQHGFDRGEIQ